MGYSEEELARIKQTGSNNISRATPEWEAILEQARREHVNCVGTDCEYEIHHAYRLANEQGGWNKCANCGSPYRLDDEYTNSTTCSSQCHNEYAASIMGGW